MSRMEIIWIATVVCSTFILASAAGAEIYRYVDAEGKRNAVSDISMVPPQYRDAALADARERSGGGSVNVVDVETDTPAPAAAQPAAPQAAAPQAASPGAIAPADSNQIGGHDQNWWRSQAQAKRSQIEDLESQLEQAKADEDDYTDQILRAPGSRGGGARPGPGNARNRRDGRYAALLSASSDSDEPSIEELEQAIDAAKRDLEALHDQARRSSVPSGWLR